MIDDYPALEPSEEEQLEAHNRRLESEAAALRERVAELEGEATMCDFLLGQFQMHSPKMDGEHSWRFLHHWPMTYAVGPDIRTAVERAMEAFNQHAKDNNSTQFPVPE